MHFKVTKLFPRSFNDYLLAVVMLVAVGATVASGEIPPEITAGLSKSSSVCAVGAESGKNYVSLNPGLLISPASVQKLLVSAVALETLGPMHTFDTEVAVGAKSKKKESSVEQLFIRAGLDPGLTTERLHLLARMMRSFGISHVDELWLDDSRLVGALERKGSRAYDSAVSAFGVNWNSITVRACGAAGQERAVVSIDPFELPIKLKSGVRLGNATNFSISEAGDHTVSATGSVEPGECGEEYFSAHDARWYAESTIRGALQAVGITTGSVGWKPTPASAVHLFEFPSRPLEELLRDMNYFSNNNMAEMFTALVGADGDTFSRELGLSRISAWLNGVARPLNLPQSSQGHVTLLDGSGLSARNQLDAGSLCSVLLREYRNPQLRITYFNALPQFGVSGTLKKRLRGLSGRAKTGSLSGVSSLAGMVYGKTEPIVFAIIQNQVGDLASAKAAEDRVVARLAER